ncbi:hypothetical protein [Amycolatopsis echigonensis]|uniref:Uncharacterized protein n=1 Tax=Amycolatopsis echigonensis TaxID=2576905 RepID=A0A2N3WSV5_9PSEU|nr:MULTISPECIES: hypothetical protein [Amycolatopsis]MBB2498771.1 hypothetical protein [Amycolatopsis echigonensis]PKV96930.1 hypothetical protein ATK30_7895 [Amycolatopsis niigatensis]
MPATPDHHLPGECRDWLRALADDLIPAVGPMPSAAAAGIDSGQLDVVLRARPDLLPDLLRAWTSTTGLPAGAALKHLRELDDAGYQAVLLAAAGSYYTNREVRELLGYTGQQPRTVQIAEDIDEDLLLRVVERGPLYRPA